MIKEKRELKLGRNIAPLALDNNIDRLSEDHEKAKRFVEGIAEISGITPVPKVPETNLVFFDIDPDLGSASHLVKVRRKNWMVRNAANESRDPPRYFRR